MLITVVVFAVVLFVESANATGGCTYPDRIGNQADYYWRDYYGIIPKDAVAGGYTPDGNVTYIGQLADIKLVGIFPGTIYAGQKEAVICSTQRHVDATYVKILCGNPQNRFEWINATADDYPLLTDYHWIIGGSEAKIVWYIGRVNYEGEVQVGRAYDSKSPHKGVWICNKSGTQINFQSFELLVLAR